MAVCVFQREKIHEKATEMHLVRDIMMLQQSLLMMLRGFKVKTENGGIDWLWFSAAAICCCRGTMGKVRLYLVHSHSCP